MNEELIMRLRERATRGPGTGPDDRLCAEAADALEAAQEENARLKEVVRLQVENYAELSEQNDAQHGYFNSVMQERDQLRAALEAAQPKDPCSTCGAQVNHYRNGCPGCGAPVCCESCCRADNLRGELAYQLTKQLVIDIPTARAAVDAAFRASTEAAQPAGEPVAYLETITGQVRLPDEDHRIRFPMAYKPLYTHPAPQVPMTDEEIDILYFPYSYLTLRKAFIAGIRIAEAHHKIGVKP